MTISDILKQYRAEHNLSQRQFADQCGVSNGYISLLEKGENPKTGKPVTPTLGNLQKIARTMGTTIDDLLSSADDLEIDISAKPTLNPEDGLYERIAGLDPDLQQQLIEFVALAQAQPEIAKRHLAFAVGELRSALQGR